MHVRAETSKINGNNVQLSRPKRQAENEARNNIYGHLLEGLKFVDVASFHIDYRNSIQWLRQKIVNIAYSGLIILPYKVY